ncbi:GNAT family N-acetyltransferase [Streptomyces sp. WM6372]|uniref:GNAT family N-acetyltransferase n=1 Tax=Streptomyces sp. WM6372 TaxID=1415555 RepID=UPI0006B034DA|nr:GNAT family N-acetyltransferase [Streptomyces sp. WM6372]
MRIEVRAEHQIDSQVHERIHALLEESFAGYPERSYFKQLPQFRYLAWGDGRLLGHMGIEHRMITNGGTPLRIFGIIDLCVTASARSQGCASRLLSEVESAARSSGADAIVLFADDPRIYLANGYECVQNDGRWLMLHEHETFGIAEKPLDALMVKMLSGKRWESGVVDMLGYLF